MTRPEPAGAGTADQNAWLENRACSLVHNPGVAEGYRTVIARLIMQAAQEYAGHLISAAITASRRQAKEEDAKIAETEASPTPIVAPLTNAAYDEAARTIAAAIRKTIDA